MSCAQEKGPLGGPGCLCGSEEGSSGLHLGGELLSCLYGSEPPAFCFCRQITFLSCLYGSEFGCRAKHSKEEFLSCLCGSKPTACTAVS